MRRTTAHRVAPALAALFALGAAASAQEGEPPAAEVQEASVQEQVDAVLERYDEAYAAFSDAYGEAETDEERTKAFEEHYPQADEFAAELMAIAERHPDDPAVAEAYAWALRQAQDPALKIRAARRLVEDFPEHEGLGLALRSLPPAGDSIGVLRDAAESDHAELAGYATFTLGTKLLEQAEYARTLRGDMDAGRRQAFEQYLGAETVAELKALMPAAIEAMAEGHLRAVVDSPEWAALDYYGRSTLALKAEGALFELHNLSVGKPAPDIGGEDIAGVEFKLSDYRGKVVFLDFWGHW